MHAQAVIAWLKSIPAVFWGVVVGSFFSLGGTALSNWASYNRQKDQHDFDRKENARERDHAMKKVILLEALEAISAGVNCLASFANMDLSANQIGADFVAKSSAIVKIHLVASEHTIQSTTLVSHQIGAAMVALHAHRLPIVIKHDSLKAAYVERDSVSRRQDALLEIMKDMNINGEEDENKWSRINHLFDLEQERATELNELTKKLGTELADELAHLANASMAEVSKLNTIFPKALAAARAELGLPLNEGWYLDFLQGLGRSQVGLVEGATRSMRTHLDDPRE